jgi:hypothetical protein
MVAHAEENCAHADFGIFDDDEDDVPAPLDHAILDLLDDDETSINSMPALLQSHMEDLDDEERTIDSIDFLPAEDEDGLL